jgi:predicted oxidoreductase (fatty acid repression mutant protein)
MSKAELFLQLEQELDVYRKMMTQASDVILDKEITKFPIMVAHQQELEIGIPLTGEDHKGLWQIHASTLEEFVQRQIIFPEKIEEFKTNYKDVKLFICVFVLSELGAQFIFLPRKAR